MLNAQRELREARGGSLIACTGKVRFALVDHARAVAVANRMSKAKHQRITTFRCPYCDGWHVGRQMHRRKG